MTPSPKKRIVIAKPGLDGHDRGAKVLARALRDAGFEVVYTGLRKSPEEIVTTAIQEGADLIAMSILSGAHLGLTRKVMDLLAKEKAKEIRVIVGGTIFQKDIPTLKSMGVLEVFPPNRSIKEAVAFIQEHL